jgi:hypothetical protein
MVGEDVEWDLRNQLIAAAVDALRTGNWQRGQGKERDRPKPIPRPGVEQDKTYGKEAIPIDEMVHWLGWERQLAEPDN